MKHTITGDTRISRNHADYIKGVFLPNEVAFIIFAIAQAMQDIIHEHPKEGKEEALTDGITAISKMISVYDPEPKALLLETLKKNFGFCLDIHEAPMTPNDVH